MFLSHFKNTWSDSVKKENLQTQIVDPALWLNHESNIAVGKHS